MPETRALQQKLADKVWHTLFGGGESAMLSPWRLRDKKQDHHAIRAAELSAIQTMLDELDDLHAGRRIFNHHGEIVAAADAQLLASIRFNPLIERVADDPLSALNVPGTAEALRDVRLEADILALRHSLNVRRIGLRADILVETFALETLSPRPVDADWLLRWKESAARAVATDFQDMWARVLVDEVRQPGTHSLRTLAFLATLSRAEMSAIRFMTAVDLGGFICPDAPDYFHPDIHGPMFLQMEAMGLLLPGLDTILLKTVADRGFRAVLRCQNKALFIEGIGSELVIGAHVLTSLGREVNALFNGLADTAYLFALGNALKKRGFTIEIGDWHGQADGSGLFSEKMRL
ncbi:MAG: DUF2806 domain-containing protein [bacterium]|nr:DUF2806 domain-containing protein [bacterium]